MFILIAEKITFLPNRVATKNHLGQTVIQLKIDGWVSVTLKDVILPEKACQAKDLDKQIILYYSEI